MVKKKLPNANEHTDIKVMKRIDGKQLQSIILKTNVDNKPITSRMSPVSDKPAGERVIEI